MTPESPAPPRVLYEPPENGPLDAIEQALVRALVRAIVERRRRDAAATQAPEGARLETDRASSDKRPPAQGRARGS